MSKIPKFKTRKEEAEYWETHSAADVIADTEAVDEGLTVSGKLKRRVEARLQKRVISLRLSEQHIQQVRQMADKKGIGYQTLLRMWIIERLDREAQKKEAA